MLYTVTTSGTTEVPPALTHLQRLEAESIHIMREVVAEADNPVMLYSIGKDSSVMLHLARKAFFPAPPPFPLLHVDTTWKFQEMYRFRDCYGQGIWHAAAGVCQSPRVSAGDWPFYAWFGHPYRCDENPGLEAGA